MTRFCRFAVLFVALIAVPAATAQVWENLAPGSGPTPVGRTNASAIYDPVGDRMIVFGGVTTSGALNDLWAFDLAEQVWTDLTPAANLPPPRETPNTVYDAVGQRLLLWSGLDGNTFFNDTWSFDLNTGSWTPFNPPEPLPAIRYGTASVFDPLARQLVTFAGFTFAGRFDDTWRFDPEAEAWTEVSPDVGPHERCLHSASYDIRGHRMIMYGGQRSGALGDTWAFDLATDSWTDITPAAQPPGRFFAAHVYDAARHRALIYGGAPGTIDEVWSFDLTTETWSEILPGGTQPAGRNGPVAIYDPTRDRMVVFGGSFRNDVWALGFSEPGGVVFPDRILADSSGFHWTVPVNVEFVRGALDQVAGSAFDQSGSATHATSFAAPDAPAPGQGYYYLVRVQGNDGSWQTAYGAQPQRDAALP